MRTQEEIVARIKDTRSRDPLGFEWIEYCALLDPEHVKEFAKPHVDLQRVPHDDTRGR